MISDVLSQLNTVASVAQGRPPAKPASIAESTGFAAELKASVARISQAQEAAYAKAQDFELGKPGIELNDVMIDMQKASIAFQTAVQVRNRLVSAYQEIASMPV